MIKYSKLSLILCLKVSYQIWNHISSKKEFVKLKEQWLSIKIKVTCCCIYRNEFEIL